MSAIETFNMLEVAFERGEKKHTHKFVGSFSKFKSSVTSGKMMNTKDSPR
jgi:DNA-binding transcriptional regulator GbsR (MarR family)